MGGVEDGSMPPSTAHGIGNVSVKKRELGLVNACAEAGLRGTDIREAGEKKIGEIADVIGSSAGEQALEVGPDPLVGVELRRVCGEMLDVGPFSLALEFPHRLSFVGDAVVPKDDDVPGDLPGQLAHETGDIRPSDVMALRIMNTIEDDS